MPVSSAGSAALPPGLQPYPSVARSPPSQPPPVARPFAQRSRSYDVYPMNISSQSLATPGMPPLLSGMRPQSSPGHYSAHAGSPYSRVNQTSAGSSQRTRPAFPPSNMPPSIPPVPPIPDLPSLRPRSSASGATKNRESRPPEIPSGHRQSGHQRTHSRRPTIDTYVANDPFRTHNRRSTTSVDKNITFDDIPVAPLEDPYASRRSYVRPPSMLVPPVPIPAIPPYPSASSEHVNGYNGIYRPTTDSTQSLSIPQPVPSIHHTPAQPPLSQVDPSNLNTRSCIHW